MALEKSKQPTGLAFLRAAPTRIKVLNKIVVIPLDNPKNSFHFHPFIESYSHTVEPKVLKQEFGLFSAPTYYRNGLSTNQFQVTIVLPAVSATDAKNNHKKVARFKTLVTPSIRDLQSGTGMVKMSIAPMMEQQVGYITAFSEEINLEAGFANGYPKVIKISFTLSVDEIRKEIFGSKKATPIRVAADDKLPRATAATTGERVANASTASELGRKLGKKPRRKKKK
jgi:hypothetical protein